jgi:hypothetical protein
VGPGAAEKAEPGTTAAARPTPAAGSPAPSASPSPRSRGRSWDIDLGGGGGALDPVSGALALGFAGTLWATRRRKGS